MEPELVKLVWDLGVNYKFRLGEVLDIINGKTTIVDVIVSRIYKLIRIEEKYSDESIDIEKESESEILTEEQIKKYLSENETELIKILEQTKKELNEKGCADSITTYIDETVNIINRAKEIINKYEGDKVKKYKCLASELIIPEELFYKADEKIKKREILSEPIISEELFYKVKKKIEKQ